MNQRMLPYLFYGFLLLLTFPVFANAPGFLAVEAIDGVRIFVDQELKAVTLNNQAVVMLNPGTYRVTLEKEEYTSAERKVTIRSGEATSLKIDMQQVQIRGVDLGADVRVVLGRKTGTIEIRSIPFRGAEITINDVQYGETDRRLTSFPVGMINVDITYQNRSLSEVFFLEEDDTMFLQANYAMDQPVIIRLFEVLFTASPTYVHGMGITSSLNDLLPEGYYLEIEGPYGTGIVRDIREPIRVQGAEHTIKYTDGKTYLDFEQRISLTRSCSIPLDLPQFTMESIFIESTAQLTVGDSMQLVPNITPPYIDGRHILWSSNDESIIEVSRFGMITAKKPGNVLITVKNTDNEYVAFVQVSVFNFRPGLGTDDPNVVRWSTIILTQGESLEDVAQSVGLDPRTLIAVNGIASHHDIYSGMQLEVPDRDGQLYTVCSGENLSIIARSFSIGYIGLAQINGIDIIRMLYPGDELFIPRITMSENEYKLIMGH